MRYFRLLPIVFALAACGSSETALLRGDRYWADSNYVAALAEYRLAAKQSGNDPHVMARVAHAYIMTGQLERARRTYETLLKIERSYEDQAIYDYVWLARTSMARGDRYGTARAAEAALEIRPGLALADLATTLAQHYAAVGDLDRALEFYNRTLTSTRDNRTALLYQLATLHERNNNCLEAVPYYEAFTNRSTNRDSVSEARWRMGACGLERGRQAREKGEHERALDLLDITLDLGAPQHLLEQAWFERAEALLALGRMDEARFAYERVLDLSPAGRTQFSTRARRRLREIPEF